MKRINKNTKSNKKNINIKVVILILILGLIITLVAIRNILTIRNIEVVINSDSKSSRITKEKIIEISGIKVKDKLYKDLRSQIAKRIEENPYVKEAKIERNINGKVKIIVTQREPEYMMNYAGEFIYIDKEGYVLEVNTENNGTPIIIGFVTDCSELSVGNTKIRLNSEDLEKLNIVNNIMATLRSNGIENKVYTIDVSDKSNFVLELNDEQKTIYIGDGSDLNTRVLYLKKVLENETEHSGIIYVNGNLDESYVYFKEQ